jgi:hypothetical protein
LKHIKCKKIVNHLATIRVRVKWLCACGIWLTPILGKSQHAEKLFKLNLPSSRASPKIQLKLQPEPTAHGFQTSQAEPKALSSRHYGLAGPKS